MKITLDQWKELHGCLKWEVQIDSRWPLSIRVRYWQTESGLAVKELFGVNGEMDYEMLQASMIPHCNVYDRSVFGEPLLVTRQSAAAPAGYRIKQGVFGELLSFTRQ